MGVAMAMVMTVVVVVSGMVTVMVMTGVVLVVAVHVDARVAVQPRSMTAGIVSTRYIVTCRASGRPPQSRG
jgi:hypothetical protein